MVDIVGSAVVLILIVGSIAFASYKEKTKEDTWTCECTQMEARGGEAVCTERICRRAEDAGE